MSFSQANGAGVDFFLYSGGFLLEILMKIPPFGLSPPTFFSFFYQTLSKRRKLLRIFIFFPRDSIPY